MFMDHFITTSTQEYGTVVVNDAFEKNTVIQDAEQFDVLSELIRIHGRRVRRR